MFRPVAVELVPQSDQDSFTTSKVLPAMQEEEEEEATA
jgi:hypothetical protein